MKLKALLKTKESELEKLINTRDTMERNGKFDEKHSNINQLWMNFIDDLYIVKVKYGDNDINKSFNDELSAFHFRDYIFDKKIDDLNDNITKIKEEIELLNKQIDNIDYLTAIQKLIRNLSKDDLKSSNNQSGEKYIAYDRTSLSGMWSVKFKVKNNLIRDKRFENLRDAKTYRDRQIPIVIKELEKELIKAGIDKDKLLEPLE